MLLHMQNFFFMDEEYYVAYIDHIFFIYSSVDEHLGCFHILAVVDNAAMNIGVHVCFELVFVFFFQICTQEWNCRVKWTFCL